MSAAAEPVGAASGVPLAVDSAPSPAADFSLAILRAFVDLGVADAVLTPGSRSQALALALAELDRAGMLALQVRLDERVAGFNALGLAVETGMPAIVVTTSGTAVANLLPAVLEAHHSRVPMLIVTADRPADVRGTAGNQTTYQPGLFGRFVRQSLDVNAPSGLRGEPALAVDVARDAVESALGIDTGDPGPVHVNLQFREPLSGAVPDLLALVSSGEWMPGVAAAPVTLPSPPDSLLRSSRPPRRDLGRLAAQVPSRAAVPTVDENGVLVLERGPRTVVIAGHEAGPAAEELAHRGGWPLLAEPSSGARYGRNLIVAYRELLSDPELGGRVQRAVVFGHPTLSREVPALSLRDDVETIVVTPAAASVPPGEEVPDVFNPGHRVSTFVTAVDVAPLRESARPPAAAAADDAGGRAGDDGEREWLRDWVVASRALLEAQAGGDPVAAPNIEAANSPDIAERRAYRLAETAALQAPITRRTLSLAVWQATWPHDRLVLGASRLIRDLDRAVPGKKIRVHANRGLAGIDGTIATATGIALASQSTRATPLAAGGRPRSSGASSVAAQHGVTRVLLGDLTLLHDAGALLFGTGEARPRIQLIVANDGGGTIFDTLEVASTADPAAFDRVMLTPQTVDLEALAKAYGWSYSRATTRPGLDRALTAPLTGPTILEVPLTR